MSLYQEWQNLAQQNRTKEEYNQYWRTYFEIEANAYRDILQHHEETIQGPVTVLAERFQMQPCVFVGFLDGINSSLQDGELNLDKIDENTIVRLNVDYDELYLNMHRAKADWLYNLKEWNDVKTEEERKALTKQYRREQVFISSPTVGRNEPCPCGSGKKYKNCCGKRI